MNNWAEQFAKELKKRENPQILGAILGTVIVPPPKLEISILNNSVIIKKCYILKNICQGNTRTNSNRKSKGQRLHYWRYRYA